jgi:hypothetical protein
VAWNLKSKELCGLGVEWLKTLAKMAVVEKEIEWMQSVYFHQALIAKENRTVMN